MYLRDDNLFVVDTGNNIVRQINLTSGRTIVFAGNFHRGYSGDNGLAIHASFCDPFGISLGIRAPLHLSIIWI